MIRRLKTTLSVVLTFCIFMPLFSVTGCSKFNEIREKVQSEQAEEKELKIDDSDDFLKSYEKKIRKALADKDKSALKALFCQTVIDTTADMDEGLEYVINLADWSTYTGGADHCHSIKEYGGGFTWEYFIANAACEADGVRYRIFFEGFGWYYDENSFVAEHVGLVKLYIAVLDDNGDVTGLPCTELNGIYHPGREPLENIINVVLNESSTSVDVDSVMSPDLLNSADKDELDALYELAGLDPKRKKNDIYFFVGEQDGGYVVSSVVHTNLDDHCLSLLIKDGVLSGAVLSDDENMKKPHAGELKGFEL